MCALTDSVCNERFKIGVFYLGGAHACKYAIGDSGGEELRND